jgi:hypothetical protein
MIGVRCDRCGTHFWAEDKAAGRSASCTRCGQMLRIPEPPDEEGAEAPPPAWERPPEPVIREGASVWLPRDPSERDDAATLAELLRTARQIRFSLAVLIGIGLILIGLLVAISSRVFLVRVVH